MLLKYIVLAFGIFLSLLFISNADVFIDQRLLNLRPDETTNIILAHADGIDSVITSVKNLKLQSRGEKACTLLNHLTEHASKCLQNILDFLKTLGFICVPLLTNQIFIKDARLDLVNTLVATFPNEIAAIGPEEMYQIEAFDTCKAYQRNPEVFNIKNLTKEEEWSLNYTSAPSAWKKGFTGKNIIIGLIDTGVFPDHDVLITQVCNRRFGLYDMIKVYETITKSRNLKHEIPSYVFPTENCGSAYDDIEWIENTKTSHGTFCASKAVGCKSNDKEPIRLGVAYDATYMMCRACANYATGRCPDLALFLCGIYYICPQAFCPGVGCSLHTTQRTLDCSKIICDPPDIVSNSWGLGPGTGNPAHDFFLPILTIWKFLRIIPVFSNGNRGPNCGTAGKPAGHSLTIGVGSVNKLDKGRVTISCFSSMGPYNGIAQTRFPRCPKIKPDLVAPGENVTGAQSTKINPITKEIESLYMTISGTSMAAPHVSGVIAILLSCNYDLTFDQIMCLIYEKNATTTKLNPFNCVSPANVPCPCSEMQCKTLTSIDTDPETVDNSENCTMSSVFPNYVYGYGLIDVKKFLFAITSGTYSCSEFRKPPRDRCPCSAGCSKKATP